MMEAEMLRLLNVGRGALVRAATETVICTTATPVEDRLSKVANTYCFDPDGGIIMFGLAPAHCSRLVQCQYASSGEKS
jgi:hypothetical protein